MTRMTGPDCAVMFYTYAYIHTYSVAAGSLYDLQYCLSTLYLVSSPRVRPLSVDSITLSI